VTTPSRLTLRQRLLSRAPVFGAWTSIGHPSITEMFTASTVDFVGIDLEHSTISQEQSQRIIAAAQSAGVSCLPRVASHNGEQVRRLLDSGADGVIVPMVSTVAQVEEIVGWTKYSPVGRRSFGIARAHTYGDQFDDYVRGWNDRSVVIIQIESIEGVDNADALLAHPAIDGVMIGPYDLSGSLGVPGELDHPTVRASVQKVIEVARGRGKACGTQLVDPNVESIDAAFAAGHSFVVLASDVFILWKWSQRMREVVRSVRSR
jgi:2-keto-3-deoxy-L-rhamnonate aldolase RhmA